MLLRDSAERRMDGRRAGERMRPTKTDSEKMRSIQKMIKVGRASERMWKSVVMWWRCALPPVSFLVDPPETICAEGIELEWLWRDYIFAVAMPTNQLTLPPPQSPFLSLPFFLLLLILWLPQQQNTGATSSAALNSAKCFSHPVFFSVIANGLWPRYVFSILMFCVVRGLSVQVYNINTFH